MKVIKVGGGCLNGKKTIAHIVELLKKRGKGHIIVVSALSGVTDFLIDSMTAALESEENIAGIISKLKALDLSFFIFRLSIGATGPGINCRGPSGVFLGRSLLRVR